MMKIFLTTILMIASLAFVTTAATVVPVAAYGHNNRDNFGGNISDVFNGSGMNGFDWTSGSPNDGNPPPGWGNEGTYGSVDTWTRTSTQYRDEWQADQLLDTTTSINGKVGWIILDLGPTPNFGLDEMYLWNGVQIGTQALEDFNLYVSNTPIVPATTGPTGGGDADDYDFGVAAWTQIGGIETLSDGGGAAGAADGIYSLGGVQARYVGIEMLSRHNGNFDPNSGRIGFAEVGFTTVPEPSTTALLGLGGLALILRRRK